MFNYEFSQLEKIFADLIRKHVSPETFEWLGQMSSAENNIVRFNSTFVSIPRRTGRTLLHPDEVTAAAIDKARSGLIVDGWPIDRLARVWHLMHLDAADRAAYNKIIENLFLAAEVNELVALYSALPVLAYPDMWKGRCAEGIRNNIADVLTAIMCNNPYPAENLDEPAWNQLVLKAFFTDKPIEQIIGIDRRANKTLAYTLSDYAHERWAAHRSVNPQLWRCVSPFIDAQLLPDIRKIAGSDNPLEREAAALAAFHSSNPEAKSLISIGMEKAIQSGQLTWNVLAKKTTDYVLQ